MTPQLFEPLPPPARPVSYGRLGCPTTSQRNQPYQPDQRFTPPPPACIAEAAAAERLKAAATLPAILSPSLPLIRPTPFNGISLISEISGSPCLPLEPLWPLIPGPSIRPVRPIRGLISLTALPTPQRDQLCQRGQRFTNPV